MWNLLATDITISDGLVYALFGFLFVFIGITLLIAIIGIMGAVMKRVRAPKKASRKREKKRPAAERVVLPAVPEQSIQPLREEDVPDEIKAAIVAAIMAFYETEKPYCGFTVKRIKRIG